MHAAPCGKGSSQPFLSQSISLQVDAPPTQSSLPSPSTAQQDRDKDDEKNACVGDNGNAIIGVAEEAAAEGVVGHDRFGSPRAWLHQTASPRNLVPGFLLTLAVLLVACLIVPEVFHRLQNQQLTPSFTKIGLRVPDGYRAPTQARFVQLQPEPKQLRPPHGNGTGKPGAQKALRTAQSRWREEWSARLARMSPASAAVGATDQSWLRDLQEQALKAARSALDRKNEKRFETAQQPNSSAALSQLSPELGLSAFLTTLLHFQHCRVPVDSPLEAMSALSTAAQVTNGSSNISTSNSSDSSPAPLASQLSSAHMQPATRRWLSQLAQRIDWDALPSVLADAVRRTAVDGGVTPPFGDGLHPALRSLLPLQPLGRGVPTTLSERVQLLAAVFETPQSVDGSSDDLSSLVHNRAADVCMVLGSLTPPDRVESLGPRSLPASFPLLHADFVHTVQPQPPHSREEASVPPSTAALEATVLSHLQQSEHALAQHDAVETALGSAVCILVSVDPLLSVNQSGWNGEAPRGSGTFGFGPDSFDVCLESIQPPAPIAVGAIHVPAVSHRMQFEHVATADEVARLAVSWLLLHKAPIAFTEHLFALLRTRPQFNVYRGCVRLPDAGRYQFTRAAINFQRWQWINDLGVENRIQANVALEPLVQPLPFFADIKLRVDGVPTAAAAAAPQVQLSTTDTVAALIGQLQPSSLPLCNYTMSWRGRHIGTATRFDQAMALNVPGPSPVNRYGQVYLPTTCRLQSFTWRRLFQCLGTQYPHMHFIGDSNMRRLVRVLASYGAMARTKEPICEDAGMSGFGMLTKFHSGGLKMAIERQKQEGPLSAQQDVDSAPTLSFFVLQGVFDGGLKQMWDGYFRLEPPASVVVLGLTHWEAAYCSYRSSLCYAGVDAFVEILREHYTSNGVPIVWRERNAERDYAKQQGELKKRHGRSASTSMGIRRCARAESIWAKYLSSTCLSCIVLSQRSWSLDRALHLVQVACDGLFDGGRQLFTI
jgi:hypothetical protein